MSGIEIEAKDVASWLGGLATLLVIGLWRKITNSATKEELKEVVERLERKMDASDDRAEASRTRMADRFDEQSQGTNDRLDAQSKAFTDLAQEVGNLQGRASVNVVIPQGGPRT